MRPASRGEFMAWADTNGIGFDPEYPDSGILTFQPKVKHGRFWVVPDTVSDTLCFIASVLSALDDWKSGWVWPRIERWAGFGGVSLIEAHARIILRGAGIRADWDGPVRCEWAEQHELIAVVYASVLAGWNVEHDVFFIPDHGRQILRTDHHGVIHVQCRSEDRIVQFVEGMTEDGFELPRDLPDPTFRRPAWMVKPPGTDE